MKLLYARRGIEKLIVAQILILLSKAGVLISVVDAVRQGLPRMETEGVFGIVILLLMTAAIVMELRGVCEAGKGEPIFARPAVILALIFDYYNSILNPFYGGWLVTVIAEMVAILFAMRYLVDGVIALSIRTGNPKMCPRGKYLFILAVLVCFFQAVIVVLDAILPGFSVETPRLILSLSAASLIADGVAVLLLILYLLQARNMLRGKDLENA